MDIVKIKYCCVFACLNFGTTHVQGSCTWQKSAIEVTASDSSRISLQIMLVKWQKTPVTVILLHFKSVLLFHCFPEYSTSIMFY